MCVCVFVCVCVCVRRLPHSFCLKVFPCVSNYYSVGSHTEGMFSNTRTCCVYVCECVYILMIIILCFSFWFSGSVCVCVFPGQGMVYWYLGISDRRYCYQQQNTGLIHTEQELYT